MSGRELSQVLQGARLSMRSLKGNKESAPNQDRAFCMSIGGAAEVFSVFDGHGAQGHTAADISCEALPKLLLTQFLRTGCLLGGLNPQDAGKNQTMREVAATAFKELHGFTEMITASSIAAEKDGVDATTGLCKDWMHFDARASGSTATVVMMLPRQRALVAHVGDSRAVLVRRRRGDGRTLEGYGPWNPTELTRDHKPDLQDEKARIEATGAQIVNAGNDTFTVLRVYTPQQTWPSINMSRSIGDLHAHTQGLSAKAEVNIFERLWDPDIEEAVLIVASDGIWDVMDPVMAAETAFNSQQSGNDPAAGLAADALDRWMRRGLTGSYTDDITVVVKFF